MRNALGLVGVVLLLPASATAATLDVSGNTLTFTLESTETGAMSANGELITFTASGPITRTGSGAGFESGSGNLAASGVTTVVVHGLEFFTVGAIDTPMPASLTVTTRNVDLLGALRTDGRDVAFLGSTSVRLGGDCVIDTDAAGGGGNAGQIFIAAAYVGTMNNQSPSKLTLDASADGVGSPGDVYVTGFVGTNFPVSGVSVRGGSVRLGSLYASEISISARSIDLVGTVSYLGPSTSSSLRLAPLDDGAAVTLSGLNHTGFAGDCFQRVRPPRPGSVADGNTAPRTRQAVRHRALQTVACC